MKQLFNEINYHIKDLLNEQWISYLYSEYLSSEVAVRKKDSSFWLTKLNGKFFLHIYPLPRIQNVADKLRGNEFFKLIYQSKASHQLKFNMRLDLLGDILNGCVPFQLINALICFYCFIEHCLSDYHTSRTFQYFQHLLIIICMVYALC